ncbi:MAG TPA: hypothetical protein VFA22_08300 [Stellaceae bacterium]|nr:hypothetical protein [Stellaceae bacterium]
MNREPIYAALFARLAGAGGFRTMSRRLRHWSAVEAAEQPALFQVQKRETAQQADGSPTVWRAELDLYVYCQAPDDETAPASVLNPLLDAIEAALEPAGADLALGAQTLGGLVRHCRIAGAIETDEGALGGQAVAIVPIEILAVP